MDGQILSSVDPARQAAAVAHLALVADSLDISQTDYGRAHSAYTSIGEVVSSSDSAVFADALVFPQGSFATRTVVKPMARNDGELDVDLACRLATTTDAFSPGAALATLGVQLRSDGRYRDKVYPKTRCWRVQYSDRFHLDICPLVSAPRFGSDAIPDRKLQCWVATAPQQYADWFNRFADRVRLADLRTYMAFDAKAEVAPFPDPNATKGWLRRTVQLMKRHRDFWVANHAGPLSDFAPISIIITTLAAKVVERRITSANNFRSEYELVETIIRELPAGIERRISTAGVEFWVASPVANENFANRWASDVRWVEAFYKWHAALSQVLPAMMRSEGFDRANDVVAAAFGDRTSRDAAALYIDQLNHARDKGQLALASSGSLVWGSTRASTAIPRHTYFGK